eukprot:TRINITY_DN629_c0_g3_i1.p1 TRINITY_DN629_c0_g3~~TRINITY_DN629_c0_g3_i1.p1  ORF type:complete len:385 (+),score=110.81 TRINITY_DN629_c0_g3_i1:48-1202(+)
MFKKLKNAFGGKKKTETTSLSDAGPAPATALGKSPNVKKKREAAEKLASRWQSEGDGKRMPREDIQLAVELATCTEVDLKRKAAQVLAHAASSEVNRSGLVEGGAVPALLAMAKAGDTEATQWSVWAVAALAQHESARAQLVSQGALEMFTNVATTTRESELRSFCANGLENLCKIPSHQLRFLRQGGLNALLRFAQGDAGQQGYAAAIMAAMVENEDCKPLMAADAGIDALFALAGASDTTVKGYSAAIIAALSQVEQNRGKIVNKNGFDVLLKLVHVDDQEVQCFAAAAVASLLDNEERRTRFAGKGGLGVMLKLASGESRAKTYAAVSICALADSPAVAGKMTEGSDLQVIMNISRAQDEDLRAYGVAALANLAHHGTQDM